MSKHTIVCALLDKFKAVEKEFWESLWPDLHGAGWTVQDDIRGSGIIFTPPPVYGMQFPAMKSIRVHNSCLWTLIQVDCRLVNLAVVACTAFNWWSIATSCCVGAWY